jgi:arsenite oxidase small subunit
MKRCDALVDAGRRAFFARTAAISAGVVATAALPRGVASAAPSPALVVYPSARLANLRDLKVNEPVQISYPDQDSPAVLLKLGAAVEEGVGPDRDIVAFSTLCPHRGFPLNYTAKDRTLDCPGHYSRFDVEKGGLEMWGHAAQNLPQFTLIVDQGGDIHAVAVDELIYGRLSNVLKS